MKLSEAGEFGTIDQLQTRLTQRAGVTLGIGDDAAVLASLRAPVVTCDALVEGVHFRRDWTSARSLGRKAMAVNVSDIAAMGARPVAAFVALGVSTALLESEAGLSWLEELYGGFEDAAQQYSLTVAGGDTTRSPQALVLSITLIGESASDSENALSDSASTPVLRAGAQVGDALVVTGTLGDSAAGLHLLQNPETRLDEAAREYLLRRHLEPTARLAEMHAALTVLDSAQRRAVHAALDLSDGLSGDALHIARRSQVSLNIEAALLPSTPALHRAAHAVMPDDPQDLIERWALAGGEDYELLLCVESQSARAVCEAITRATSTPATIIGHCAARDDAAPVKILDACGKQKNVATAWRHF